VRVLAGDFLHGIMNLLADVAVAMIDLGGENCVQGVAAQQGFGEAEHSKLHVGHTRHQLLFCKADALDFICIAAAL
jgi:hypothetical protein